MIDRIFISLDGVLADFAGGAAWLFERPDWVPVERNFYTELAPSEEAFWDRIQHTPNFWENLQQYPWADNLLCTARKRCRRITIASTPNSPTCAAGKLRWLRKHAPTLSYVLTPNKQLLAREGRVLIDDSEDECQQWTEAGGQAILFPTPWNLHRAAADAPVEYVRAALRDLARELSGSAG